MFLHSKGINVPNYLLYREETGHDGARYIESAENLMSDSNISSKIFVPLALKDEKSGEVLWQNGSSNSAFYARPILLVAEK